ncbi:TlpA disulfide reductase family protein [Massilia sp. YIM B02763]|uniref:TlpA family protein disulfide reductase n=1 Tax=Massilia sp. YIM B02763 TaxID=3050130 RepID=UPI0025B6AAFA|nr:TlpA disulfide reductase family protein [Massilia sp. YIM B02763]MDN4055151.1 TlpA disulfide reductase family protein [Massilia sp. YIM B02763]
MNKKKLAGYAILAAAFTVLGAIAGVKQDAKGPVTTTYAPTDGRAHTAVTNLYAQSLNDLSGKPQALSQWKGKPLLVNFWASWCAPCVSEMPELSELAAKDGGKRFNVIGIGIDSPTNLAEFAKKIKISYPLYVGGMGATDLARGLGNANGGLPYTVLIGADGQVKKTYLGRLKFDQLRADLAKL